MGKWDSIFPAASDSSTCCIPTITPSAAAVTPPADGFHQFGLEKPFVITDAISLVIGGGIAYSDGYFGSSDWNHYYATVSLPIQLNCRTTLTPYLGYTGATDGMVMDGITFGSVGTPQSDISTAESP